MTLRAHTKATDYAAQHGADLIPGISDTTRARVKRLIWDAVTLHWGVDKLADKIAETGLFSAERAEMIARTEINMAQNADIVEAARQAAAAGRRIKIVSTRLPEDFGTKDYGLRRAEAISKHLSTVMCEPQNFPRLFQLWLSPSANLRNYLWAHRNEYIQVAQELVNVLPGAAVIDILRYLAEDFWARRTGWPNLLVYRSNEYFFAEVKTARSRLGQNKERWICDCRKRFHLPFKLVEVRKAGCSSSSPNHVPTPWGAA